MIVYRRNGLRFGECWFEDLDVAKKSALTGNLDLLIFNQSPKKAESRAGSDFYTLVTKVDKEESEIWKDFSKHTKNRINKVKARTDLEYRFYWSADSRTIASFLDFFNSFAGKKNLTAIGKDRFMAHVREGAIFLSATWDGTFKRDVSWHAYIVSESRIRLLYSASRRLDDGVVSKEERDWVGHINCWHHWKDILACKDKLKSEYDWGGWSPNPLDQATRGINEFKERFCMNKEESVSGQIPITVFGKVYLWLVRLKRKFF